MTFVVSFYGTKQANSHCQGVHSSRWLKPGNSRRFNRKSLEERLHPKRFCGTAGIGETYNRYFIHKKVSRTEKFLHRLSFINNVSTWHETARKSLLIVRVLKAKEKKRENFLTLNRRTMEVPKKSNQSIISTKSEQLRKENYLQSRFTFGESEMKGDFLHNWIFFCFFCAPISSRSS